MLAQALTENGFLVLPSVLSRHECETVCRLLPVDYSSPGTRNFLAEDWCKALAGRLRMVPEVAAVLPRDAMAVQCTFFAKSPQTNWSVAFHRDLSIPVKKKIDTPHCKGWSEKEGVLYTQPPRDVLEELVAIRVHLDDCGTQNGPLRVFPRSHSLGQTELPEALQCLGMAGSAVIMKPLLIHGSSKAVVPSLRRVLHFLFGRKQLRYGLEWNEAV